MCIIIYYYYVAALRSARLRVLCRWCVKLYRKVVRSERSPCVAGLSLSPCVSLSGFFFFTRLFLLRDLKVCVTPSWSAHASHDARLDVLVGDLLVVVVRAAARRVHRRGRHGVEGEDELLSVAHARRLGMVAGNTCGKRNRVDQERWRPRAFAETGLILFF